MAGSTAGARGQSFATLACNGRYRADGQKVATTDFDFRTSMSVIKTSRGLMTKNLESPTQTITWSDSAAGLDSVAFNGQPLSPAVANQIVTQEAIPNGEPVFGYRSAAGVQEFNVVGRPLPMDSAMVPGTFQNICFRNVSTKPLIRSVCFTIKLDGAATNPVMAISASEVRPDNTLDTWIAHA